MAESIRLAFQYDESAEKLYELFTSKEFYEARASKSSAAQRFSRFDQEGDVWHIHIARDMELKKDKVPGALRKLVAGGKVAMETRFSWKLEGDSAAGDYAIHAAQMPIKSGGKMTLKPNGDGCEHIIELSIDCSIPLVGKKIARFLVEKAESGLKKDHLKTVEYLQQA